MNNLKPYFKTRFIHRDLLVIWLDPDIDENERSYREISSALDQIVGQILLYRDIDQCIDFVSDIEDKKVLMILPATLPYQPLVSLIHDIPQLYCIYVVEHDATGHGLTTSKFGKVKKVSPSIENIYQLLLSDIEQYNHDFSSISVIGRYDTTERNFNELPPSFMYSQIFKEILLDIDHDTAAKEDLIHFWYEQYHHNEAQLKTIGEFERTYTPESAIHWYTRVNFTYSILNQALRTMDAETIIKMRFFLRDLLKQIQKRHIEQSQNQCPQYVYRGQGMFNDEFEKLRVSCGGLLSFNNFLSTSTDAEVSKLFCPSASHNPEMTAVLFKIKLDRSSKRNTFAFLDDDTAYTDEQEILFSMHSIFRIDGVSEIAQDLWQVRLSLSNDDDPELKRLTEMIRQNIGGGPAWHRLGQLLLKIGYNDEAQEIYEFLTKQTNQHENSKSSIYYNQLGICAHNRGDFPKALNFYFQQLENFKASTFAFPPYLAATYSNIASIYVNMGQYSEALKFYGETLNIEEKFLPSDCPDLAITYENIAVSHRRSGNYSQALEIYGKVLRIHEKSSLQNHPDLARTYNNIAILHHTLTEYPKALEFHLKTLKIQQQSLLPHDRALGVTHQAIGNVYRKMRVYSDALKHHEKALEILKQSLRPNDSTWGTIYNNVGVLYMDMDRYPEAMEFFQKAKKTEETVFGSIHPDLVVTYNNIAAVHAHQRENGQALEFYEKACSIAEKTLGSNRLELAYPYKNMGVLHYNEGRYAQALSLFEKALGIYRISLPADHPEIADCVLGIDLIQNKTGFFPSQ